MPRTGLQAVRHDVDPAAALRDRIGFFSVKLAPCQVLVATYVPPERLKSGLYIPDKTRDEALFQGKCGLVIRLGPLGFHDSPGFAFGGFAAGLDDWAVYRVSDGFPMRVNGVDCRLLRDSEVRAVIDQP